jgi:transcriptional regulator GlxA family with amidase domain
MEQLLNRLLETLDRREPWAEEEFDCIMKQIFLLLHRRNSRDGEMETVTPKQRRAVSRIISLIREQGGRRITHEELAAQVGLSPQYASRLFKRCTGVSLKEFMTQARLERAMHLLSETTMNVSQVAEALGYDSVYLFSKQFKQKFGDPPSRFLMSAPPPKPHGKR